jgi:glycosyltransferase family protein
VDKNGFENRIKVFIWGTGKYGRKVFQVINDENCKVEGFIDNDPAKHGKTYEGIEILPFRKVEDDYDIIIISIVNYDEILYQLKLNNFTDFAKIIVFFDETYCENSEYFHILDPLKWKIIVLEQKVEKLERIIKAKFNNIGYEIIDKYNKNLYQFPKMGSTEEAIDKIVNGGCSLVRYGDGEFDIMAGKESPVFQNHDPKLAIRLLEVISARDEKLLIGIANNYGNLDVYADDNADVIRCYMNEETRKYHMSVLEKDRVYYDAYMFKSYFPYKNRENTWKRVALIKKVWENRDVVIVEGDKTRAGYGNDLFDNVKSLRRILTPTKNAFPKYDKILSTVLKVKKECLILVILGPTAELLVYDLMKKGYQAVDIGQIDMDYEWYRVGAQKKVPIPDRYVSQLSPAEIAEVNDAEYLNQILERV